MENIIESNVNGYSAGTLAGDVGDGPNTLQSFSLPVVECSSKAQVTI